MEKRLEWVRRVNRENLRIDDVTKNTKLCSDHFSGSQPSQEQTYPCFFKHKLYPLCVVRRKRRVSPVKEQPKAKRVRGLPPAPELYSDVQISVVEESSSSEQEQEVEDEVEAVVCQESPEEKIARLEAEVCQLSSQVVKLNHDLKEWKMYSHINVNSCRKWTDEKFSNFTGLSSFACFEGLCELFEPDMCHVLLSHGSKPCKIVAGVASKRSSNPRDELLLVLVKLRCGLPSKILLELFDCVSHHSEVTELLKTWIPFMAEHLEPIMPSPSPADVRANLPTGFRARPEYHATRMILDCSEFEVERPSSLSLNAMFYSDYKGRTTVKVLFGVTPDGCITFVSPAFPGAISSLCGAESQ